ncbi:MAG: acylphosphatase [Planctomycetota bacterium]|nr:acylphosphatase [Planctomycetota bacterium]
MNVQLRVNFRGRVQGVGFRYQTHQLSRQFAVTGYVQNLDDGTVDLVCEGKKTELQLFFDSLKLKMADHIHQCSQDWCSTSDQFTDFQIRR